MKWTHRCSLDWMRTRQKVLTASDVKELLPYTPTGKPRKVGEDRYLKVLANKLRHLTEDDCISVGAAARGHMLEKYAIMCYNQHFAKAIFGEELHHWDDLVVGEPGSSLGFSPDAMNHPPMDIHKEDQVNLTNSRYDTIGEIKSYGAERHLLCGNTKPEDLEERWQVATAMAAVEWINNAVIMFFNPSMEKQMFVAAYEQRDLKAEIDVVLEVQKNWISFVNGHVNDVLPGFNGDPCKEQEIIEIIEKEQGLNP